MLFLRTIATVALAVVAHAALVAQKPATAVPARPDEATIVHVLNRIGFGPTPDLVDRVRRTGLAAHIEQQLHPERITDDALDSRLRGFETLKVPAAELAREYFGQNESARQRQVLQDLSQQKIVRAIYGERQLEEVLVDFWFNHFNVFAGKGPVRIYLASFERDAIRPHVLGRFRDLLGATARHPAMLFYLDNWQNTTRGLNENYGRELMELHTLGVDGGYTQKDVQEVARAFTGWTIDRPRQGGSFVFRPRLHDRGAKVVLGERIAAGGGAADAERVLDILAAHPSTARFIATKLARRFVSDTPPPALVNRAAATFRETRGDLRAVVRAIVTSPEFLAPSARGAKIKTPFELVVSAARSTGYARRTVQPLVQASRELGMPLYGCQPPTGYADTAEAWINTGTLVGRMNFAMRIGAPRVGSPEFQKR
jgi:uncharacterized protein (DUF1800 family)